MALFGRPEKLPDDGVDGVAVITQADPHGDPGARNNSGESILDLELNRFGTRKYTFRLEVRLPGSAPYEVAGVYKVPRKAENVGWFGGSTGVTLSAGLELPVRVDRGDPQHVVVDWDRFLADPRRKGAQKDAKVSRQNQLMAEKLAKDPKLQAQLRANSRKTLPAWTSAVQMGRMSREDFDRQVRQEVESGRMVPADAAAAYATLDGPPG